MLDDIISCIEYRGAKLGKQHTERFITLGAYASPLLYINGERSYFDYNEGPDALARLFCSYD